MADGIDDLNRALHVGCRVSREGYRQLRGTALLSDDGATWLGTAALVRAPDPDMARAVLTPDPHADIDVHNWLFGGWTTPEVPPDSPQTQPRRSRATRKSECGVKGRRSQLLSSRSGTRFAVAASAKNASNS